METRVLTLFDDEFFPPEPPKEKPKKEKVAKAAVSPAEEDAVVEHADENVTNETKDQVAEPSVFQEEDIPVTAFESERLVDDKVPVNEALMVSNTDAITHDAIHESINNESEAQVSEPSIFEEEDMPVTAFESERLVDDKVPVNEAIIVNYTDVIRHEAIHENINNEPGGQVSEPSIFQEEDMPVTAFESERLVDDKIPVNEDLMVGNTEVAEHIETVHERIHDEAELLLNENNAAVENEISVINVEQPATEPETAAPTVAEDTNKELNQQILSELIQLDYTALMQKNYSFDLNYATVINKELPKPNTEPVAETEEETEEEEVFEEVTPLPEWNLDKKYYTIGEVAQLFAVNTSHIRFWTNEFKLRPRTTRKGDRLYSPKDIAELRLIHHLVKEKKHTIKGAREKLKAEKTGVNNKLDLKESLMQLRNTLLKIKEQL